MDNNQLVNVVKTLKKTELVFGTNNCTLRVGKSDIKVEDQDGDELISIYPEIREREYRVLYSSPTLDKHGTSTATELKDFWEANNFFFDIGSQVIADGRVEFRADLPITIGFPAVGAIYVVEKPTTILLGLYTTYQSGWYIKDNDTGSLSDWRRLNIKTKFTTSEFAIVDSSDQSKQQKHNLSEYSTATTRDILWRDRDGKVMFEPVNIVHVESLSDFPTPVSNFIPLTDNTIYYIHGVINIGANGFDFTGVDAKLQGNYNGSDEIVSTTTGNLIKGIITFGISINDLKLTSLLSDKHFNISGTGNEIFIIDNVLCEGSLAIGTINDLSKSIIRNQTNFQGFSQGILFSGSFNLILFRDVIIAGIVGTSIDFGTSLSGSIEMSASIINVPNGGIGINVLPNGGNFSGGDHGIIFGCEFILNGTGVSEVGYSPLDLQWNVLSSENIDDSDRIIPTGWGFYQDGETTPITQLITTVPQKLSIDGAGAQTETSFLPKAIRGNSDLWDIVNNKITPIVIGDSYDVGIDIEITAKSGGVTQIEMVLDIGGGAGITNPVITLDTFVGKTPPFTKRINFLMFSLSTFLLNGGQIFLSTDTGDVTIGSRQITISRNSSGAS